LIVAEAPNVIQPEHAKPILPKTAVYAKFVFPLGLVTYYETVELSHSGWVFESWLDKQLIHREKYLTKLGALNMVGRGWELREFRCP
jgi:hypothetical protein